MWSGTCATVDQYNTQGLESTDQRFLLYNEVKAMIHLFLSNSRVSSGIRYYESQLDLFSNLSRHNLMMNV